MRGLKWIGIGLVLVLGVGGGLAWWQREPLQTWWTLRGLTRAGEDERAVWIERVRALGEPAISGLLECLSSSESRVRDNGLAAIDDLGRSQGIDSPTTADLIHRLGRGFARLEPSTQAQVLHALAGWFSEASPAAGVIESTGQLLADAATIPDADVQKSGLELARAVLRQSEGEQALPPARDMVRQALRSSSAEVRLEAVRACLHPGMNLLEQVVSLLRDPSTEVRRAAILAVGPAEEIVREDVLLPGLHDSDADVRKHTEAALRSRGLRPEHLELGRLLTHPRATTRLDVLDHIRDMLAQSEGGAGNTDLDPGVWLRRLSHDQSPAVRAAAVRLMSQQSLVDLNDRIDQMARSDPSPTVSQLAQFYLRRKQSPEPQGR